MFLKLVKGSFWFYTPKCRPIFFVSTLVVIEYIKFFLILVKKNNFKIKQKLMSNITYNLKKLCWTRSVDIFISDKINLRLV